MSEALKKEIYGYVTGTGGYRAVENRSDRLRNRIDSLLGQVSDLEVVAGGIEPSTTDPPDDMGPATYLTERVSGQIDGYYRPKARELSRRLEVMRRIELTLGVAAALLAAVAAVWESDSVAGWVAVATTVAGAVFVHRESARYEHLVVSYSTTAHRLHSLRTQWTERIGARELTPEEQDRLVRDCEDAISVENQAWMASWSKAALE